MASDAPTPDADSADVARTLAGEFDAYRRLVERHQGIVLGMVGALLAGRADREDVAQEAFLAAWENLRRFDRSRGSFVAWILRIARNRALNHLRAVRRTAPVSAEPEAPLVSGPEARDHRIDRAVADLPAAQRTVFLLAVVHALPLDEVARVEDVPVGTVKSRLSRAKEALRGALRDLLEPTT